jgi:colanic acid biosynthesis glycosyl transferase WcaI
LFHLIHAGKLGTAENPERPTWALLKGLQAFFDERPQARAATRLTLAGPPDEATNALAHGLGLSDVVVNTGSMPYEKSLELIGSASVCILVEALVEEGIFLPSKLTDYVAAGKPVLALSPEQGVVADFPPGSGIMRVNPRDPHAICGEIVSLFDRFQEGTLHRMAPGRATREQYSASRVASAWLAAVQPLVSGLGAAQRCPLAAERVC